MEKRVVSNVKLAKSQLVFPLVVSYFVKEKLHTIRMPLDPTVHSLSCLAHSLQLDGSFNSCTNSVSGSVLF